MVAALRRVAMVVRPVPRVVVFGPRGSGREIRGVISTLPIRCRVFLVSYHGLFNAYKIRTIGRMQYMHIICKHDVVFT